jgi:nucleotide-binding universal stress UspA family protein
MVMAARRKLEDAFSAVAGPRVSVRYHVAIGDAAEVISGYAQTQRADLLLMGLRADSPERTLIGSTLERVMRSAPCPVLTMRSAARSLVAAPRLARVLEAASAAPSAFA